VGPFYSIFAFSGKEVGGWAALKEVKISDSFLEYSCIKGCCGAVKRVQVEFS
jgi:hypothetical protein